MKREERDANIGDIEAIATYQTYADEQLVLISGTSARELEEKWGRICKHAIAGIGKVVRRTT